MTVDRAQGSGSYGSSRTVLVGSLVGLVLAAIGITVLIDREGGQKLLASIYDLLGNADVPVEAYWGIHTLRAVENFPITGVSVGHFPDFVRALVLVKQAAARANRRPLRGPSTQNTATA